MTTGILKMNLSIVKIPEVKGKAQNHLLDSYANLPIRNSGHIGI
jgi:hypothetical protein